MKEDFISYLGYANLDTRLKRISDRMSHSIRAMYKELDIDIEPNWYLILILTDTTPNISVMEIAKRIKFTHQSVINMTNKMIANGYLISAKDMDDKRKTVFRLTEKAKERLPLFIKIWEHGKTAIYEMLNENTAIIKHLEVLESNLDKQSFGERMIEKLKQDQ